jgi:site-specific recombinase XerC
VRLVVDGLGSENSWASLRPGADLLPDVVRRQGQARRVWVGRTTYRQHLEGQGLSPSYINLALSAVRKLAQEAADNGYLDSAKANGIAPVKGVKSASVQVGNCLTREQAQALLDAPDVGTPKGARDRAILAVMLGGGLHRSEVAALRWEHIHQRDGRWAVVDLMGKSCGVRSVPLGEWVKAAIDQWQSATGLEAEGNVFRPVSKGIASRIVGD